MSDTTRRTLLAGAMALGATAAAAQDQPGQPIEGKRGATILGPRNPARETQNPDILRPPSTDGGGLPNLHFSFADSPVKMRDGGWSRQVTQRELPIATTIAGVDMRLTAGGVRELHWHKPDEWAFVIAGKARITGFDEDGRNFVDDVGPGDLWYFPGGIPHSIQGLSPEGTEFLLAFTDGLFTEDSTFPITDMFAHFPRDILAKNFGTDEKTFAHIPSHERFIFQGKEPPALAEDRVRAPAGPVQSSRNMSFRLMQEKPLFESAAGTVRIVDSTRFPIATQLATALVEVNPGHMREIHWHPNADEWQYYISGQGRMTVFGANASARTFDYRAGDVGYVPMSMPHYVENTGQEKLRFLELFKAPHFEDISLTQWMALTPHELVAQHLDIDQQFIDGLSKEKKPIV